MSMFDIERWWACPIAIELARSRQEMGLVSMVRSGWMPVTSWSKGGSGRGVADVCSLKPVA
jgi:hypothetical protein